MAGANFRVTLKRQGRHEVGLLEPPAGEPLRKPRTEREPQAIAQGEVEPKLGAHAGLELGGPRVVEGAAIVGEGGSAYAIEKDRQGRWAAIDVDDRKPVFCIQQAEALADFGEDGIAAQDDSTALVKQVLNDVDDRQIDEAAHVE